MLGGPTMNLLIAAVLYTIALVVLGVPSLTMTRRRGGPLRAEQTSRPSAPPSDPESPAAAAGRQAR